MQQIFNFVIKNKTFLLFLLLFSLALVLTIQSHSYHRSKFLNSSNALTGGIYGTSHSIGQYFNLKHKNAILVEENKYLREQLLNSISKKDPTAVDSNSLKGNYRIITAQVFKNSYSLTNNYLTLNKGKSDSINIDFGVITSKGILGIVNNTSNNYSSVLSILNKNSSINAILKSTNHMGSLKWNGESPYYVQLVDVSKFAPVKIGDTIITGGQSTIFPKGIGVGTVESFETDISGDTYIIQVKLFNDMTSIGAVYIIENLDKLEIQTLENSTDE